MRKLLIILFLLISTLAGATNYYVKNGGSDAASGLSDALAWETITKVNAVWAAGTFAAGDNIYFNRGNAWYGVTLVVSKSGSLGSPITIGAYGAGADPIISGWTTFNPAGWSVYSGSIYEQAITSAAQSNAVTVDNVMIALGRYPDAGTNLTYTTASSTQITDPGIGDVTDWAGAELAINKNAWTLDRCSITDHTGDVFTFTNRGTTTTPDANRYYFIENDLRCVTATNEWYHSTSAGKLYIYGNPAAKTVKMATINYLIDNTGAYDYITVDNINFQGSISDAIYCAISSNYWTVQNCTFTFIGGGAIKILTGNTWVINANTVSYCNGAGFYNQSVTTSTITNNNISYIGMLPGQALTSNYYHPTAIYLSGASFTIQYNTIHHTSWSGINAGSGTSFTVQYNYIYYPLQILDDGGGIYLTNAYAGVRKIEYNIILYSGIGNVNATICEGIYLDENTSNAAVKYNTIAHSQYSGIKLHMAASDTIQYNILYNNGFTGIYLQESTASTIHDNIIDHNYFIAKDAADYALYFWTVDANCNGYGTSNNNYFARPIDDDYVFRSRVLGGVYTNRTLTEWKAYTSQDAASLGSPITIADTTEIDFYYNYTGAPVVQPLAVPMIDLAATKYATEYSIPAYYGVVLLEDPAPSPPPTQPTITTDFTYRWATGVKCGGSGIDDGGGTITAKGVCYSTDPAPTTADNTVSGGTGTDTFWVRIIGLIKGTTYHIRAYATNAAATSYGADYEFTTSDRSYVHGSSGKIVHGSSGKIVID